MSSLTIDSQQLEHPDAGINIISKVVKGPKADPHIYSDLIHNKDAAPVQWEKFFQ